MEYLKCKPPTFIYLLAGRGHITSQKSRLHLLANCFVGITDQETFGRPLRVRIQNKNHPGHTSTGPCKNERYILLSTRVDQPHQLLTSTHRPLEYYNTTTNISHSSVDGTVSQVAASTRRRPHVCAVVKLCSSAVIISINPLLDGAIASTRALRYEVKQSRCNYQAATSSYGHLNLT